MNMEQETQYGKEQLAREYGQYYQFIAEGEFYAVNEVDSEEVKAAKQAELDRIMHLVEVAAGDDISRVPTAWTDDKLTSRLVASKMNEISGDYYHARAMLLSFDGKNEDLKIARSALEAYGKVGRSADLVLFTNSFSGWLKSVLDNECIASIGNLEYKDLVELVDELLGEMKTKRNITEETIEELRSSLEMLVCMGEFPDNVLVTDRIVEHTQSPISC